MRWILLIFLALQVATCGQKGPLTLPENTALVTLPATVPARPAVDVHP